MARFIKAVLLGAAALSLGACSSWVRSLRGEEEPVTSRSDTNSRAPASNGSAIKLDNGGPGIANSPYSPEASGPNLSKNEFAAQARTFDEKAGRGYRRQADPWDGTGPVNEGSLWNPDGQDNFYFSKNLLHKIGDIVMVKLEPDVIEALNTRINSLLARNTVNQVLADEAGKEAAKTVGDKVGNAIGNDAIGRAIGNAAGNRVTASIEKKEKHVDVEEIPVRITESLPRSSFRIAGVRRINIRNAPYMLHIFGVVRDEDIGPNAVIATSKVLESKLELTR